MCCCCCFPTSFPAQNGTGREKIWLRSRSVRFGSFFPRSSSSAPGGCVSWYFSPLRRPTDRQTNANRPACFVHRLRGTIKGCRWGMMLRPGHRYSIFMVQFGLFGLISSPSKSNPVSAAPRAPPGASVLVEPSPSSELIYSFQTVVKLNGLTKPSHPIRRGSPASLSPYPRPG